MKLNLIQNGVVAAVNALYFLCAKDVCASIFSVISIRSSLKWPHITACCCIESLPILAWITTWTKRAKRSSSTRPATHACKTTVNSLWSHGNDCNASSVTISLCFSPEQRFSEHIKDERNMDFQKKFILKRDDASMDKDDNQVCVLLRFTLSSSFCCASEFLVISLPARSGYRCRTAVAVSPSRSERRSTSGSEIAFLHEK